MKWQRIRSYYYFLLVAYTIFVLLLRWQDGVDGDDELFIMNYAAVQVTVYASSYMRLVFHFSTLVLFEYGGCSIIAPLTEASDCERTKMSTVVLRVILGIFLIGDNYVKV